MPNSKLQKIAKGLYILPTIKRKSGYALLLSFWAAVLVILSDAAYGGCLLKLQQYEWAAPAYQWLAEHTGYAYANLGFFALYLSLTFALAGCLLGLSVLLQGSFLYKPLGIISTVLSSAALWYAAPSWFLTGCGMAMLLLSPHTHTIWDRVFALFLLLMPLSAFYICKRASGLPKPVAHTTNDL